MLVYCLIFIKNNYLICFFTYEFFVQKLLINCVQIYHNNNKAIYPHLIHKLSTGSASLTPQHLS